MKPGLPPWPACLDDLPDSPVQLDVAGQLPDWTRTVGIVGTRRPDTFGADTARKLARDLASIGYVVVSGGAEGIDTEAHWGALEAGGITVAVLATGLERPYPAPNRPLFRKIAERGCVLSETVGEVPGYASMFLARNRLIAALSSVVVVAQAPFQSGAMSTAAHAKKLGRPILAVPHSIRDPRGQGCLELIARGAGICRTAEDVLSLAAPRPAKRPPKHPKPPEKAKEIQGLDEDEQAVVKALSEGPLDADELCEASGLTAPRVHRAVLMLMLSKVIQEVSSGRYARTDYI